MNKLKEKRLSDKIIHEFDVRSDDWDLVGNYIDETILRSTVNGMEIKFHNCIWPFEIVEVSRPFDFRFSFSQSRRIAKFLKLYVKSVLEGKELQEDKEAEESLDGLYPEDGKLYVYDKVKLKN